MMINTRAISLIQIICSLLIVNYHSSIFDISLVNKIAKGGFILNTVFVFLSGYLLSLSYLKKQTTFFQFINKRVKRIYPSFWVVLFLTLFYSFYVSKNINTIAYLKWFSGLGYFFSNNAIYSNDHLWFVSVILVCYLLFIPTFRIIKKVPFLFISVLIFSIVVYQLLFSSTNFTIYQNISSDVILRYLYHYLIFCISIYWTQNNKKIYFESKYNLLVLAIAFPIYFYFINSNQFSFISIITAGVCALFFISFIYQSCSFFENKFSYIFILEGISFEIYLVHYLILNILNLYFHENILGYLLVFIFTIPIAFLINRASNFVQVNTKNEQKK